MKILILLIACIALLSMNAGAQERAPRDAAEKSLATFKKLITEENFRGMGFESVDEINKASLGEPLKVFIVPLDRLQRYQEGSDPKSLLVEQESYIYPVKVDDKVRSSLTLSRRDNQWTSSNFGRPNYMKMVGRYQKEEAIVVDVLALNLSFIGMRRDGKLMLTSIMDSEEFEFRAGEELSAEEVFRKILPAAKEHDGLPR